MFTSYSIKPCHSWLGFLVENVHKTEVEVIRFLEFGKHLKENFGPCLLLAIPFRLPHHSKCRMNLKNSQKDEDDALLGCYISYSNYTKLLFPVTYMELFFLHKVSKYHFQPLISVYVSERECVA